MPTPNWAPETEALLVQLWNDKVSAGMIALRIQKERGEDYTRNAIIGKAHRMGLAKRGRSFKPKNDEPKPKRTHPFTPPKALKINPQNHTIAPAPSQPMQPEPEPDNIAPIGQRCSIFQVEDDKCHWPLGDPHKPDFAFCGGKTVIRITPAGRRRRLPYCNHHALIAYPWLVDQRR